MVDGKKLFLKLDVLVLRLQYHLYDSRENKLFNDMPCDETFVNLKTFIVQLREYTVRIMKFMHVKRRVRKE